MNIIIRAGDFKISLFCLILISFHSAYRHRILTLARDVSNLNPKDPYFPVVRHKDMYTGFSWATGIVPGSRQEESASEVSEILRNKQTFC